MKSWVLISAISILSLVPHAQGQDSTAIVSAFFGLDNALPFTANLLCPGALGMDGMPVNFSVPIDASSLSASDFQVRDSLGNLHTPMCAVLAPANEDGENRTVLLIGEFGTAATNPPVAVSVVGDLFTTATLPGESACSEIINLLGASTTNVVPLEEGPSLFFAQRLEGPLEECGMGNQTIQVAWNGGITPFRMGDTEADLFRYYTGYSDSAGMLIPHAPVSISDINDNDNFHQLCFSTSDPMVRISVVADAVEDPNLDPNPASEVEVRSCEPSTYLEEHPFGSGYRVYPNPFTDEIQIEHGTGEAYLIIHDVMGRVVAEGVFSRSIDLPGTPPGRYYLTILQGAMRTTYPLIRE